MELDSPVPTYSSMKNQSKQQLQARMEMQQLEQIHSLLTRQGLASKLLPTVVLKQEW
jgi:hypothetical protein